MSSLPLFGKIAIVTGGSRSIGAAIAIRLGTLVLPFFHFCGYLSPAMLLFLGQDGANVIVNYVSNSDAADGVVARIAQDGKGNAISIKADLATESGRRYLIEETVKQFGKIDIL